MQIPTTTSRTGIKTFGEFVVVSHWLILVGNYSGVYRRIGKFSPNPGHFIANLQKHKIGNLANEHHDKGNENTKKKIK